MRRKGAARRWLPGATLAVGLGLGVSLALGPGVRQAPAPAEAAGPAPPGRVAVLQFNLCGNGCRLGQAVVDDVTNLLAGRPDRPLVLTLNEVCRSQFDRLTSRLPGYTGSFRATIPARCDDDSDFGLAVLVRSGASTGDSTEIGSWTLTTIRGDEPRAMVCRAVTVDGARRPVAACSVHIDFHAEDRTVQLEEVARIGAHLHRRYTVIIGGDVNATPPADVLDPLYSSSYPRGRGIFEEADAAGHQRAASPSLPGQNEFTGCGKVPCGTPGGVAPVSKIDNVFVSQGDARDLDATVLGAPHSDHAMVWASLTLN